MDLVGAKFTISCPYQPEIKDIRGSHNKDFTLDGRANYISVRGLFSIPIFSKKEI